MLNAIGHDNVHFSYLYKKHINPKATDSESDSLWKEMTSLGLIRKADFIQEDWDIVVIDSKGDRIRENGGWLNYLADKAEKENKPTAINLHIGDKGNIQKNYGTIGESMNQVSESEDSFIKLTKPTSKQNTPTKNKISKYILYPFVVGVLLIIVALILKYGFGITY